MTRPDRSASGRTMPYPPLALLVAGVVGYGVVTNQALLGSLVAAGVVALYGVYRAVRARQ